LDTVAAVAAVRVAVAAVEVALAAAEVAAGVPGRRRRRPRPRAAPTTGRPAPSTCSFGTSRNWKI